MARQSLTITEELHNYLLNTTVHMTDLQTRLRDETGAMPNGGMQISPEQGKFMAFLVKALGVRRCLEIGVFTGYSSLEVAMALPDDGHIVACDISPEFTTVARRYWAEAGVADKITLHVGPAADTLDILLADGQGGKFDFAFIDADKSNYDMYYEASLQLLREGGVILIDNTLWAGKVADLTVTDDDTVALRELNVKVANDDRVDACLLPVGDGVTLVRKKEKLSAANPEW